MPASHRDGAHQTIGAVLAQLTPDFPDLTISKIRFLEAEGLVTPQRTGSGYRTYAAADVERLRYILSAQRDRFWPLKVIRDALDALDRGLTPVEPATAEGAAGRPRAPEPAADPLVPSTAALRAPTTLRLTSRELRDEAGLDRATFDALENFGLVKADPSGHFDEDDLTIARTAAALASFGVEARHLRPFRTAADREIGLVQQIARPARAGRPGRTHERTPDGGRMDDGSGEGSPDPTPEILRLFVMLHTALLRAGLGSGLGSS